MLPSSLPEGIGDGEPLARFLTSDSQFNRAGAKPSAFMPAPSTEETSVFRQDASDPAALWTTADREIGTQRRTKAAAIVTAAEVRRALLEAKAEEPPPRHANIVGWPAVANDPDLMRAQRKERALQLASVAELVLR